MPAQDLPDDVADVFGSGIEVAELFGVEIEVLVVEALLDLFVDEVFEDFQVDQVAGFRIYFAGQFDLQLVVVTVVMRVIAQAEDLSVLLL